MFEKQIKSFGAFFLVVYVTISYSQMKDMERHCLICRDLVLKILFYSKG